jgi:tetratricopeptide (TPR) repeat protein
MVSKQRALRGVKCNQDGLAFYKAWALDKAIASFQQAVKADPDNPEYHLNLARSHARGGDFGQAMSCLGEYLRTETIEDVAARYERLFSTALDGVEKRLVEVLPKLDFSVQQVGKAIQMWLEYRITIGRRPLRIPKPDLWAAALAHAIVKVNFVEMSRADIAAAFGVSDASLKKKYGELVSTLDLMPSDYRYFLGEENPLDKLVEAAQLLEDLDRRFQEE